MPKYMLLGSYSSESWARMIENPGDRTAAARAAAEAVGGSVEALYWAFGPDDVVVIADIPDDTTAAAVSVAVTSSGALRNLRTIRLFSPEEGVEMLRKAQTVAAGYRRPGT